MIDAIDFGFLKVEGHATSQPSTFQPSTFNDLLPDASGLAPLVLPQSLPQPPPDAVRRFQAAMGEDSSRESREPQSGESLKVEGAKVEGSVSRKERMDVANVEMLPIPMLPMPNWALVLATLAILAKFLTRLTSRVSRPLPFCWRRPLPPLRRPSAALRPPIR